MSLDSLSTCFALVNHDIVNFFKNIILISMFNFYKLQLVKLLVTLMLSAMSPNSKGTTLRFGKKEFSFSWDGWILIMP